MATEKITRICAMCGGTFEPRLASRRFCSGPCYQRQRVAAQVAAKVTKVCQQCGVPFEPKQTGMRARMASKFCSQPCYQRQRGVKDDAIKGSRVCPQCGMTFTPKRASSPARFCSRLCSDRPRKQVTKSYRATNAGGRGRLIHRVRAEAALGHPLPHGAEVHHVDGTRSDTSALVICQDHAYHFLLHRRMRIKAAGGNPNTDSLCGICHLAKHVSEFARYTKANSGVRTICRSCRNIYKNKRAAQARASRPVIRADNA